MATPPLKLTKLFAQLATLSPTFLPPLPPPLTLLSLPYIQGTTDHISKILAKKNIKTVFKPFKTLKQSFKSSKDKFDPMLAPGVYQIPCSCGKSYISQTGRSFKSHLKENIADTTHNHISKSTIVEYSFNAKHLICFDKTRTLASTPHYSSRVIREALEIEKTS